VVTAVRTLFGRYRIDPTVYRDKITEDLSPDPGDRVHAAAAVYGDVVVLLSRNLKHLRTKAVLAAGVKVVTADEHLCALLTRRRQALTESFIRAADSKQKPPMTAAELADRIATAGAPRFAERVGLHLTG